MLYIKKGAEKKTIGGRQVQRPRRGKKGNSTLWGRKLAPRRLNLFLEHHISKTKNDEQRRKTIESGELLHLQRRSCLAPIRGRASITFLGGIKLAIRRRGERKDSALEKAK